MLRWFTPISVDAVKRRPPVGPFGQRQKTARCYGNINASELAGHRATERNQSSGDSDPHRYHVRGF